MIRACDWFAIRREFHIAANWFPFGDCQHTHQKQRQKTRKTIENENGNLRVLYIEWDMASKCNNMLQLSAS